MIQNLTVAVMTQRKLNQINMQILIFREMHYALAVQVKNIKDVVENYDEL